MAWTDDPVADFAAYDRRCQRKLARYPVCACCQEHITEDKFYIIEDKNLCESCLDHLFAQDTEDYIQEDDE